MYPLKSGNRTPELKLIFNEQLVVAVYEITDTINEY